MNVCLWATQPNERFKTTNEETKEQREPTLLDSFEDGDDDWIEMSVDEEISKRR